MSDTAAGTGHPGRPDAAVILAGGAGRRLGGADKPALAVAGRSLLQVALDAVGDCPVVVVGPDRPLPPGVLSTREEPPGGGPAAGLAAGIAALPTLPARSLVAVLAADLPGLGPDTVRRLCSCLLSAAGDPLLTGTTPARPGGPGGAVLIDRAGRRQFLAGVWRLGQLRAAIERAPGWHGQPLRRLLEPIQVVEIPGSEDETADVDTPDDWRRWQS